MKIRDKARVENSKISDDAEIYGNAVVKYATIEDSVHVFGAADISGQYGTLTIKDDAKVSGGRLQIRPSAVLEVSDDVQILSVMGTSPPVIYSGKISGQVEIYGGNIGNYTDNLLEIYGNGKIYKGDIHGGKINFDEGYALRGGLTISGGEICGSPSLPVHSLMSISGGKVCNDSHGNNPTLRAGVRILGGEVIGGVTIHSGVSIRNGTKISGNGTVIHSGAQIQGTGVHISGGTVYSFARVEGFAQIQDTAQVYGRVGGRALVSGASVIRGRVRGDVDTNSQSVAAGCDCNKRDPALLYTPGSWPEGRPRPTMSAPCRSPALTCSYN